MKKFIYTIAAAMTLAACSSEDNLTTVNEPENNKVTMTFTASQEGEAGTRAGLNAENRSKINWSENDKIIINGAEFILSSGAGTGTGVFSGTTAEAPSYTAVYPCTGNETYDPEGQYSNVVLPSEQTATANSFDPKAALMMAVSTTKRLEFKNAVGFIKVTPQFDCKKIILRAADKTVPLAGKGTLKFNVGQPYIDFTNSTELSYTITLSGTITDGNDYYIAVPAKTLTEKWTLTFITTDDKIYIRQSSNPITFARSKALNLGEFATDKSYWISGASGLVPSEKEVDLGYTVTLEGKVYKVIFANSNLTVTGLAATATDLGDYFTWDAIEPWCTKYTVDGTTLTANSWAVGKTSGYDETYPETEGDAATLILGGDWMIPTEDIWTQLNESWTTGSKIVTESNYLKIKGASDDAKYILLPCAGYFTDTNHSGMNTDGKYLSSSSTNDNYPYASFTFTTSSTTQVDHSSYRSAGCSIRPIRLVEVQSGSFEDVNEDNTFNWQ